MSNGKQKRKNKKNQNKADEKERRAKRKMRRELIKLNSKKLLKKCKEYKVKYDKNRRNETVDKLLDKIVTKNNKAKKKNKKIKKLSLTFSTDELKEFKQYEQKQQHQILLRQSSTTEIINTDLTPLSENTDNQQLCNNIFNNHNQTPTIQHSTIINNETNGNKNENDSVTEKQIIVSNNNNNNKHEKRKSIIDIIACAPKMNYDISNLHGFDTVKDIKDALPVDVKPTNVKLFYGGYELNDNKTLTQLDITNGSEIKVLISWREFKPDPKASHPRDMEHRHYDKVAELKRLNDFNIFSKLIMGIQRECNKNNEFIVLGNNEQRVLHEYCICLSGDRTYDRKWTPLHSLCYNYQNDIDMVVDLLREHNININNNNDHQKEDEKDIQEDDDDDDDEHIKENLYIDQYPHSGHDTPLKMVIQRANPKELPQDEEERTLNEINAIGAIELVEFLLLNGARRRIGLILTNLERTGNDDHTYPFMDDNIRDKLIDILKPYEEEDPWKPGRKLTV